MCHALISRGTRVATQAALKHMKSGGRIIMIGSGVGERVMVPGPVPYSAAKGAVRMFTPGLSREVGRRAAPALDRYGRVDEVAAPVAFVAAPESSYITGSNLAVDGGTNA